MTSQFKICVRWNNILSDPARKEAAPFAINPFEALLSREDLAESIQFARARRNFCAALSVFMIVCALSAAGVHHYESTVALALFAVLFALGLRTSRNQIRRANEILAQLPPVS